MKVRHIGTGSVQLEGVGVVANGEAVEVPEAIGQALCSEQPTEWEQAGPAPAPPRAGRTTKGGGD